MSSSYSERIVAFIDILGFAQIIERMAYAPELHKNVLRALKRIQSIKSYSLQANTAQSDLQVSVFSDSIVISGENENLHGVVWTTIHLQCELLAMDMLVRGGISRGRTVHENDILYGEGMLKAYHLESRAAIYPRIVLDPPLVESLEKKYKALFLKEDTDGLWFIDPFTMGMVIGNADVYLEDGYDPHEESLKILGQRIQKNIQGLTDAAQIAKWTWLQKQYAAAVAEFALRGEPRFWNAVKSLEAEKK